MIKQLTLKNFRKCVDETMVFTKGLNTIRGRNESSKSTRFEAVLYALYGSATLRTPFAEVVTWGCGENSLSVTLVIELAGRVLTFKRSKSAASVTLADGTVYVTGQKEVSAFAAEQLGADAKIAAMLMLASQSDLRGSLDEGPAAVSALIGRLADFETIDTILARAQERLLLGADKVFVDQLAQVREQKAQADATIGPLTAEVQRLGSTLAQVDDWLAVLRKTAQEDLRPKADAASAALAQANAQFDAMDRSITKLGTLRTELKATEHQAAEAKLVAANIPDAAELARVTSLVEDDTRIEQAQQLRRKVAGLPAYPDNYWEGTFESFQAEQTSASQKLQEATQRQRDTFAALKAARGRLITNGKCPTCGHAAVDDAHVAEHNAPVLAEIERLQNADTLFSKEVRAANQYVQLLQDLARSATPFTNMQAGNGVQVDTTVFPPRVVWVGGDLPTLSGAKQRLAELQAQARAADMAAGRAQVLEQQAQTIQASIKALQAEIAGTVLPDVTALKAAHDEAMVNLGVALNEIDRNERERAQELADLTAAKRGLDDAQRSLGALGDRMVELEENIKLLAFNNTLMRKLKGLKPAVTDYLWGLVLSSVSTFFSQIRGEQSVVSKDGAGFKVNGHDVKSLSGSTLDALAIAIRVALTKTFVPQASFLLLDEPCHGADSARTSAMLGFLAGAGFTQTLIATHDAVSESVADHVINLGD